MVLTKVSLNQIAVIPNQDTFFIVSSITFSVNICAFALPLSGVIFERICVNQKSVL